MINWKTAYKSESYGDKNFGVEVRVAVDRPLNENDDRAMYKIADEIEAAIMAETMRLDPEEQKKKNEEREKLLALFGDRAIFVEEIANGYCSRWCCSQSPWYIVTTPRGRIKVGWRKRVIEISWQCTVGDKAEKVFPAEDVTKVDYAIHAWGYEKAKEYIDRLLQT